MIGMVLVSHGQLAYEFSKALQHVVGKQELIKAICIDPEDDIALMRKEIAQAIEENDTGDGVILFTDLFGGTPSNLALTYLENDKIEVVAGLNLPMLIKSATLRKKINAVHQIAQECSEAGKKHITVASHFLT